MNYRVKRGDNIKVFALEEHADGTLWSPGKYAMPLIDSMAKETLAFGLDKIQALVKAKKYEEIPTGCYARVGVSPSGLEVRSFDDINAEKIAAMTPAQKERKRISELYAKAERRFNASDDNNITDYYHYKQEADAALKVWQHKYPKEAALETCDWLEEQAAHEEYLAQGAMLYDADGSISDDEQIERRDEHLAKAKELREQAKIMREMNS